MMWSRGLYPCLTSCRPQCSQEERSPELGKGGSQPSPESKSNTHQRPTSLITPAARKTPEHCLSFYPSVTVHLPAETTTSSRNHRPPMLSGLSHPGRYWLLNHASSSSFSTPPPPAPGFIFSKDASYFSRESCGTGKSERSANHRGYLPKHDATLE
ncbi:hypothetical protein GH733_013334, partial [Mirounga leonina]